MRTKEEIEELRVRLATCYPAMGAFTNPLNKDWRPQDLFMEGNYEVFEKMAGVKPPTLRSDSDISKESLAEKFRWWMEVEAKLKWMHADMMIRHMPEASVGESDRVIDLLKDCLPSLQEFAETGECSCDSENECAKCAVRDLIEELKITNEKA